jgi:Flp pilus assembly protein TadG
MAKNRHYSLRIRKFFDDKGGNVAITAGVFMIPLVMLVISTLDYARASTARSELQALADASLLSLFQTENVQALSEGELADTIANFIRGNLNTGNSSISITGVTTQRLENELQTTVKAELPATVMSLFRIQKIEIVVSSHAKASGKPVEIALALDVTGSMRNDMGKLREASQLLVDIITSKGRNANARIALVPYTGAVNIGNDTAHHAWLEKTGASSKENKALEFPAIGKYNGCDYHDNSSSDGGDGGNIRDGGWLQEKFMLLLGVTPAHAATPYSHRVSSDGCFIYNPLVISNWRLLENVLNATWKGCVEARPEPYDVSDTPPSSNPNTLWPIYFWPDTRDFVWLQTPVGSNAPNRPWNRYDPPSPYVVNNYIPDAPHLPGTDMLDNDWGRAYSVLKYNNRNGTFSEVPPSTSGPNKACPDPILPLTNDYDTLSHRITTLSHYEDSGTNGADGVAWAWRTLSPSPPFEEGLPSAQANKIIVLLSDGENEILREIPKENSPTPNTSAFLSHYSAYGILRFGRFPADSFESANNFLNERMLLACGNAKAAGVEIYVIGFGLSTSASKDILRRCSSGPEYILDVNRDGDLTGAFSSVAKKIIRLHVSQ